MTWLETVRGGRVQEPLGQRLDGSAEPGVGQDRRLQAAGQLAPLPQSGPQVGLRLVEELLRPLRGRPQALPGEPDTQRGRDELLLSAVVQVPLDPAALGVRGGDDAGPGLPHLGQLRAEPVLQPGVVQQQAQPGGDRAHHRRVQLHRPVMHDHPDRRVPDRQPPPTRAGSGHTHARGSAAVAARLLNPKG